MVYWSARLPGGAVGSWPRRRVFPACESGQAKRRSWRPAGPLLSWLTSSTGFRGRALAVCPLPGYTRDPKRTVAPVLLANSQGSGLQPGPFFVNEI